jgi:hypothetical protein
VNRRPGVLRLADLLLQIASRILPRDGRADTYAEWVAELPYIFGDDRSFGGVRGLAFAGDNIRSAYRTTHPSRRHIINAGVIAVLVTAIAMTLGTGGPTGVYPLSPAALGFKTNASLNPSTERDVLLTLMSDKSAAEALVIDRIDVSLDKHPWMGALQPARAPGETGDRVVSLTSFITGPIVPQVWRGDSRHFVLSENDMVLLDVPLPPALTNSLVSGQRFRLRFCGSVPAGAFCETADLTVRPAEETG